MGEVHEAIKMNEKSEVTMEAIKETMQQVMFEQTKHGQKERAKQERKNPFRRKSTVMNLTGSKW